MLVRWDEDNVRIPGRGICALLDIRSDDHTIAMAFEGSRKFIIPVTLRIKHHVKDDQLGAGVAQLVDELCVDGPRPGKAWPIFCNTGELRTSSGLT